MSSWGLSIVMLFGLNAVACQQCTIVNIGNSRIIEFQTSDGSAAAALDVRVRAVIPVSSGEQPKQQLSCLTTFEIGRIVQRGRSGEDGKFSLSELPDGKYWIAARGKSLQAVYLVLVEKGVLLRSRPRFLVSREGLVNNKCDIEPINLFFK